LEHGKIMKKGWRHRRGLELDRWKAKFVKIRFPKLRM
jgi:hypothetical protein